MDETTRMNTDPGVRSIREVPFGQGARMLKLEELCEWLNITERHARKLVERDAIPYRKVGHLLRFAEREIEEWTRPNPRPPATVRPVHASVRAEAKPRRTRTRHLLPKSLIEFPAEQEGGQVERQSA